MSEPSEKSMKIASKCHLGWCFNDAQEHAVNLDLKLSEIDKDFLLNQLEEGKDWKDCNKSWEDCIKILMTVLAYKEWINNH